MPAVLSRLAADSIHDYNTKAHRFSHIGWCGGANLVFGSYGATMAAQVNIRGYKLFESIGSGAESVIYRARHLATGEVVAIKHISIEGKENQKYLRHMHNEYQMLRSFQKSAGDSGPNGIVRVYRLIREGLFRRRKQYSLVMQYVNGLDLRKERRYPIGQLVDIVIQVAEVLSWLHANGIIHGDLKPENIIVDPSGHATLVDFGFSCKAGSMATSIRGTRDYMAPEQVNMGCLTEKTDIYNFGATMYFLVTGRNIPVLIPAVGDSSHFIASRSMNPISPRSLNPSVPSLFEDTILRCVKREVIERPSSIDEVREALARVRSIFLG